MNMRILRLLFLSVFVVAAGQTLDIPKLELSANQELEATKTPGAAIGVVSEGRLIYAHGFGTSNLETGAPVTSATLFRLGSTTKMMTAAAVATFAAEGRLQFDDAVGKYVSGLDPAIAALTVNQILSHTSGLKDAAVMNGRHDDASLGEEIRAWKSDWLFTKPGAIYSYSNPGYWLAGFVAESIAGKPYAEVMLERVFSPLGMTSTTLRPTMAMTRELSQGHDMVDKKLAVLRPAPDNAANWPAGSVFSNLTDLARLVTVMMDDGKPALSPKVVKALTTPHADIPGSQSKYGYGLDLEDRGGFQVWTHGGSRAGYGSFIAMMPSLHAGLIVLCNRTGENLPKTRAMIMAMLGEPLRGGVPIEETAIPATEFGRYLGSYRNGDATVQIVTRAGKLFFRQAELKKTSDGFLVMKTPDGRTTGRVFPVFGPDGKIEYLHQGGRSSVRVR